MILGSARVPFHRPAQAGFYNPKLLPTGFYANYDPFATVLPRMAAVASRIGAMPPGMQPVPAPPPVPVPLVTPGMPKPGPTAGAFGGPGINAYRAMRNGTWPGVRANAAGVNRIPRGAGAFIKSQTPAGYVGVNIPG